MNRPAGHRTLAHNRTQLSSHGWANRASMLDSVLTRPTSILLSALYSPLLPAAAVEAAAAAPSAAVLPPAAPPPARSSTGSTSTDTTSTGGTSTDSTSTQWHVHRAARPPPAVRPPAIRPPAVRPPAVRRPAVRRTAPPRLDAGSPACGAMRAAALSSKRRRRTPSSPAPWCKAVPRQLHERRLRGRRGKGGVITFNRGAGHHHTEPDREGREQHRPQDRDRRRRPLSGGAQRRILYMNTCDPNPGWTTSHCQNQDHPQLTLQNLTFVDGASVGERCVDGGAVPARGGRLKIVNSRFFRNQCDATGPIGRRSGPRLRPVRDGLLLHCRIRRSAGAATWATPAATAVACRPSA